jgi:outer membrane protein assembly factor BamD (BamD/ComL family)
MSISALSSSLIADLSQQQQNPFQQIKQDFQQLASALQSGNLSQAQSAYASIQQVLQANAGSAAGGASNTLQNDFAALGQALQSGGLTQAQSAFSELQSDFQAGRQSAAAARGGTAAQASDRYVSQGQNAEQVAQQDYTRLASDLQAGNLAGAQSDYANLQQLVRAYQGPSLSTNAIQKDFGALGQDLQSGNLAQSQGELSQLQGDFQTATQNPVQQVRQDYGQLAGALQSGNLTEAQSAYRALEQELQTQSGSGHAAATNSTAGNDPIANDLKALGQALSSGNLTQAQSAFSQLQSDVQTAEQSATGNSQTQGVQASPAAAQQAEGRHYRYAAGGSTSSNSGPAASSINSAIFTNSYGLTPSLSVYG